MDTFTEEVKVVVGTQKVFVNPAGSVVVEKSGPEGPRGFAGEDAELELIEPQYGIGSPEVIGAKIDEDYDPIAEYNTGVWNALQVREHGQVIYDEATNLWVIAYTGRRTVDGFSSVGISTSIDKINWVESVGNPVLPLTSVEYFGALLSSEDPYFAKNLDGTLYRDSEGRAYLYTEEKDGTTHVGVNLWKSGVNVLTGWTLFGQVLDHGADGTWDQTDRSSPVVLYTGSKFIMLYEGRTIPNTTIFDAWSDETLYNVGDVVWIDTGITAVYYKCKLYHTSFGNLPQDSPTYWEEHKGQLGSVGYADSDSGEEFTAAEPPILSKGVESWCSSSLVPDDVIKVGATWFLTTHGSEDEITYGVGRFQTQDEPENWTSDSFKPCVENPYTFVTDTIMMFGNDPTAGVAVNISSPYGNKIEKVNLGPGFASYTEEFDPTPLQNQVNALDGRLDSAETTINSQSAAITNLGASVTGLGGLVEELGDDVVSLEFSSASTLELLLQQAPKSLPVTSFDIDSGTFGGTAPGGSPSFPNATLVAVESPWDGPGILARVIFSPESPTANHSLIGVELRLKVVGNENLTNAVASLVLFDFNLFGPIEGKVVTKGPWIPDATHATADFPVGLINENYYDVFLTLDSPFENPDAAAYWAIVQLYPTDSGYSIGDGCTITIESSRWVWDKDLPITSDDISIGVLNGILSAVSEGDLESALQIIDNLNLIPSSSDITIGTLDGILSAVSGGNLEAAIQAIDNLVFSTVGINKLSRRGSGQYQSCPLGYAHGTVNPSTSTANSGTYIMCTPILVTTTTTFDRVGIYLQTAATDTGSVLEFGYCGSDASDLPNYTAAVSLGSEAITSPGKIEHVLSSALTLTPGLYWLLGAFKTNGTFTGTNPLFYATLSSWGLSEQTIDSNNFNSRPIILRPSNGSVTSGTAINWVATGSMNWPRLGLRKQ